MALTCAVTVVIVIAAGIALSHLSIRLNTQFTPDCTAKKFKSINPGMTRDQVIGLLGPPLMVAKEPDHTAWHQLAMTRMGIWPPDGKFDLMASIAGKGQVFAMPDGNAIDEANQHIDRTAGVLEVLRYAPAKDIGQAH